MNGAPEAPRIGMDERGMPICAAKGYRMPDAAVSFPELELLDQLLSSLEALIQESDEAPLAIEAHQRPRRAVYRVLSATSPSEKKSFFGEAIFLDATRLVLRCNTTTAVRQTPIEATVQAEKSGRGETTAIITGKALTIRRVRGGYDIDIEISETRKIRVTPSQKLRECVDKGDSAAWNRWCQDIRDSVELVGMDLHGADLSGYDLCCADLTGSDLAGANLTGAILAGSDLTECNLEKAVVTGTDFFRAKLNRAHAPLVAQAGLPEVESVIFTT